MKQTKISNYGHWVYFIGCQWDWRRWWSIQQISWQTREATRWYCSGSGWSGLQLVGNTNFFTSLRKHGRSSARMVWRYFTFFPIPASWQEQYYLDSDGGGGKVSNSKKEWFGYMRFPLVLLLGGCGENVRNKKHSLNLLKNGFHSIGAHIPWILALSCTHHITLRLFEIRSQMGVAGPWSMVAGWHINICMQHRHGSPCYFLLSTSYMQLSRKHAWILALLAEAMCFVSWCAVAWSLRGMK